MAFIFCPRSGGGRTRRRWLLVSLLAVALAAASVELAAACSCDVGQGATTHASA